MRKRPLEQLILSCYRCQGPASVPYSTILPIILVIRKQIEKTIQERENFTKLDATYEHELGTAPTGEDTKQYWKPCSIRIQSCEWLDG